ncbi:MAG: cyclic nucleotide-binding domain-containing protein [Anaerolineae bacterium]|nr:cyclic nucleotide-binding domain-containing protein [Anaerolineae bacterium]
MTTESDAQAAEIEIRGVGLWQWVQAQLDIAHYRPQAAPGVVVSRLSDRNGIYFVIKNPAASTYYRLSQRDHFLWERMDGTQTVKDLVVAFFMAYGSFAFARVAGLVAGLKANRLLVDQPVLVYQQASRQLQRRSVSFRVANLWQAFLQKQFAISGMDRFLAGVYNHGGRLLFTWPAQLVFVLVSLIGVALYMRLFTSGAFNVLGAQGSVASGLLSLLLLNLISILLHEMSHGLTVKHYGREVRRAGFMIYFGLPAFFVDTTDIWLEGKRPRLAVTWAGPYSGLILAGICGIVLTLWPGLTVNALLFQFAFLALLTVFVNLNPLLELDGYYLLMDWLEIPMLRRKSLEFLRSGLWARLQTGIGGQRPSPATLLRGLSRDERIFTVFGFLSALWTAYAVLIGISFWQARLAGSLSSLFRNSRGLSGLLLALVGVLISLAFVVAVGTYPLLLARRSVRWTAGRGLFSNLWRVAAMLVALAVALALLPRWFEAAWLEPALAIAALAAAGWLAWRNSAQFASSRLGWSLRCLAAFAGLMLLATMAGLVAPSRLDLTQAANAAAGWLRAAAWVALLQSGLILLASIDLRQLSRGEKLALLAGWLISYPLAVMMASQPGNGVATIAAVAAALVPLLTLTCLTPTFTSFWRTGMGPGWAVLALALASMVVAALAGAPATLSWLLLAAAATLHWLALRRLGSRGKQPEAGALVDDRLLLQRAFDWTAASVLAQFSEMAGRRAALALASSFNNLALAAGWPVKLRNGQVVGQLPTDEPLAAAGQTLGAALTVLLDLAGDEIGQTLALRTLQRAYDSLAWEDREVGGQYMFRHVAGADALSAAFESTQRDYARLLRQMPLFSAMSRDEIELLAGRLQPRQIKAGRDIVRQGDPADDFFVVASGQVEVIVQDEQGANETVNRLARGDYFGELALLRTAVRSATCRAVTTSQVLALSRADFDQLVRGHFSLRSKLDESVQRWELLRTLPLFAELDGVQVQAVAAGMHSQRFGPGQEIVREGEVGDLFYVVETGRVQVFLGARGTERVLRQSGPGEYFGEIALLAAAPRTASVRALEETTLLALRKDNFERLVAENLYASRALELESSRRMLQSRRSAAHAGT